MLRSSSTTFPTLRHRFARTHGGSGSGLEEAKELLQIYSPLHSPVSEINFQWDDVRQRLENGGSSPQSTATALSTRPGGMEKKLSSISSKNDSDIDSGCDIFRSMSVEDKAASGSCSAPLVLECRVENAMKELRILIVEDSTFQRKLMTRKLMSMLKVDMSDDAAIRQPVVAASSGEEALALVNSVVERTGRQYDLLVVDQVLDSSGGVLTGHEIIQRLRQRGDMGNTLMIGCTANIKAYGETILAAGANAVWAKPMQDEMAMRECVKQLLAEVFTEDASRECASHNPKKSARTSTL